LAAVGITCIPTTLLAVQRTVNGVTQAGDDGALRVHRVRLDDGASTSLADLCRQLGLGIGAVFDGVA
jgi:hypothetical protein